MLTFGAVNIAALGLILSQNEVDMIHTAEAIGLRRRRMVVALRIVAVIAGVYQLLFAEHDVGVAILLSVFAISLPSVITRGRIKALPLDFELILSLMVVLQFVVGETLNFYENIPYFDLFVHFAIPMSLGFCAFIFAYTMQETDNLHISMRPLIIILVLVTLGLGALWEICEYLWDTFAPGQLQGSITSSPLVDTMDDLIADGLGGMFGALLGVRYMLHNRNDKESRISLLIRELVEDYNRFRGR